MLMVWFNNPFLIELKVDKNLSIFAINYILGKKTISITLMEFYISNGNTAVSDAQMWSIENVFVDVPILSYENGMLKSLDYWLWTW